MAPYILPLKGQYHGKDRKKRLKVHCIFAICMCLSGLEWCFPCVNLFFRSLIRTFDPRSKVLPFGFMQIHLLNRLLIRTFVPANEIGADMDLTAG